MSVESFYYYEDDNWLEDQDGNIVYDVFRYITPGQYRLFKEKRGTYYIYSKTDKNVVYEFVFPLEGEFDDPGYEEVLF